MPLQTFKIKFKPQVNQHAEIHACLCIFVPVHVFANHRPAGAEACKDMLNMTLMRWVNSPWGRGVPGSNSFEEIIWQSHRNLCFHRNINHWPQNTRVLT